MTWLFDAESFAPMAKLVGDEHFAIVTDHLGTPVLMADARGECVWSAGLSIYGELRELHGERHACPFRWPGQYEDAETGLYYNRFRYYDAQSGQYLTQDPTRLAGGLRLQGYVRDPTTLVDPLGLEPVLADPRTLNFSQRTVASNVDGYTTDMRNQKWDWDRSGPLRVLEQDGQLVSYDNRRLLAAREAGLVTVPIELVDPKATMPGSKRTWEKAFAQRMADERNVVAGGVVPRGGLQHPPKIAPPRKGNHCAG